MATPQPDVRTAPAGTALVRFGNGATPPPPPPPPPSIVLSATGSATAGAEFAVTATAADLTVPLVITPARVSGPTATFSPTSVTAAIGDLVKLFGLTAAAAGTLRIQATAPGGVVSNALDVVVGASAPVSITLTGPSTGTNGVAALFRATLRDGSGNATPATVAVTVAVTASGATLSNAAPVIAIGQSYVEWTVTRTGTGSSFVGITSSPVLTPLGSPIGFATTAPAPVIAVSTGSGIASATLASSAGVTGEAFAFGMALKKGAFPSSSGIVLAGVTSHQIQIRNAWDDGSAKFLVVAGRCTIPAASSIVATLQRGTTVTGTALTEANLLASGVDATLQYAGGPVMTLSALIGVAAVSDSTGLTTAGRVRQLVAGPQMSSWLYACRLSSGNAHVIGWMEVRYFGGTKVHVLPWVENGFTRVSGCAGQAGTLTFALGGTTRCTLTNVHLANHCRVVAQDVAGVGYWNGTAPDVYAAPDPTYLQSTGMVPPYFGCDTSGATARLNGIAQVYSPTLYGQLTTSARDGGGNGLDNGDYDAGMGTAGYHPGIGPLPEWDAFYLTSKADQRAWRSVIANAMGYGRFGVHFRDENTLRPVIPADVALKTLPQGNNYNIADVGANQYGGSETLPTVATYDPSGLNLKPEYWAQTHHPSGGFTAYLLTGQEFFLELSQFIAGTCFLRQNNYLRENGKGYQRGYSDTTRGASWALRSIFQAATISRDGDAVQAGFVAIAQNNIADYLAKYITSPCGSFGVPRPYSTYVSDPDVHQYRVNAWELDFSVSAWGYGLSMEPPVGSTQLADMRSYFMWHAQWPVSRLGALGDSTTYGFNAAGRQNSVSIAPSFTDAPWVGNVGPWYANPGAMFQDTIGVSNATNTTNTIGVVDSNNGFFPDATSYWGNLQLSVAYAVQFDVPGAWEGFLRMINASNWSQFDANAASYPVGALRSTLSPPSIRAGMTLDAWNTLSGTTWNSVTPALIPTVSPWYRGTDPRNAMVKAYCDPAFDPLTGCLYFWGGGHGDGTYNGVIKFDPSTKAYTLVGDPTSPSVYLPGYAVVTTPIYYPSGVYFAGTPLGGDPSESPRIPPSDHLGGFFYTAAEGLNPTTDAGYIPAKLGKIAAHTYAAMVIRGRKMHTFCTPGYGEFDLDTGLWSGWDVDLGAQIKAFQSNLKNYSFSQGNAAVYDPVTDRIIVTLQPGDYGMGYRNGVFVFDPVTKTIESLLNQTAVFIGPAASMVLAGRKVYIFYKAGGYGAPQNMNKGLIYNIDAKTFEYFSVTGDPAGTIFSQTVGQECIPAWFDGTYIQRWNHEPSNVANVHSLNLTPTSGTGTFASPYMLTQTSRAVASPPSSILYRYRGNYWPAARAMVMLPNYDEPVRMLPLS